jgi:Arc/MetJ-type ribon-helix-helix transcriptional regulator
MKERITISVEPETLEFARGEVEAGRASSVSAAIEDLLDRARRRQAIREGLAMLDEIYGPTTKESQEWARRELDRAFREISSLTQER